MTQNASRTPLTELSASITAVIANVAPSVVAVHSHRSRSSGFI